jgi:Concanavalin A-like lectin/glucanases superfamily
MSSAADNRTGFVVIAGISTGIIAGEILVLVQRWGWKAHAGLLLLGVGALLLGVSWRRPMRRQMWSALVLVVLGILLLAWEALPDPSYKRTILGTPGLISYWRLGESSGRTAYDEKGTRNGEYVNAVGLRQPGVFGPGKNTSVVLSGPGAYLHIPHDAEYNLNAFTIEFWLLLDAYGSPGCYRELITKGRGLGDRNFQLSLRPEIPESTNNEVATISFSFATKDSAGKDALVSGYSTSELGLGVWYHVAFVHESAGPMRLYINGEPEALPPSIPRDAVRGLPVTSD